METNYANMANTEEQKEFSLNEFFAKLSRQEERSLAWQIFKKALKNFLLIVLYLTLAISVLIAIGFAIFKLGGLEGNFLLLVYSIVALVPLITVTSWSVYLMHYNILRVIHGNSSTLSFTEMKSVQPHIFMFFVRIFVFSLVLGVITSPFNWLLRQSFELEFNLILFLISLPLYCFVAIITLFLQYYCGFFLVFYPKATLGQAFDISFKFIWQNFKSLKYCLLFIFGINVLTIIFVYGAFIALAFIMYGLGSANIVSVFLLVILCLLPLVLLVISQGYIFSYVGVIFKKYEAKKNLPVEENLI